MRWPWSNAVYGNPQGSSSLPHTECSQIGSKIWRNFRKLTSFAGKAPGAPFDENPPQVPPQGAESGGLAPLAPKSSPHAGTAETRARTTVRGRLGRWTHFVKVGFARAAAGLHAARSSRQSSPRRRNSRQLGGRIVKHRKLGGPQPLDLVAQPRRLFEVQIGRGFAHARLQVADHRLEIVAEGGRVLELAAAAVA